MVTSESKLTNFDIKWLIMVNFRSKMLFPRQKGRFRVKRVIFESKIVNFMLNFWKIFFSKHSWLVHSRLVHSWLLIHWWLSHRIWVWLVWVLLWVWIIHPLWPLSGGSSLLKQNSQFLFVTCIFWSYHANPNVGT